MPRTTNGQMLIPCRKPYKLRYIKGLTDTLENDTHPYKTLQLLCIGGCWSVLYTNFLWQSIFKVAKIKKSFNFVINKISSLSCICTGKFFHWSDIKEVFFTFSHTLLYDTLIAHSRSSKDQNTHKSSCERLLEQCIFSNKMESVEGKWA